MVDNSDVRARDGDPDARSVSEPAHPQLRMSGVTRTVPDGRRRRVLLDRVDLDVAAGELVALMGPSGSGKTTLIRIAAGLDPADAGQVVIDGRYLSATDCNEIAAIRRRCIGYVEQRWNLLDSLTVRENVMLPLELDGMAGARAADRAMEALESVGMVDAAAAFPGSLSGGEQQRVAIARALVGSRRLVLADEPTGALDAYTAEVVMRVVRRRCDDTGAAVLLATHDPAVSGWADRVLFLREGTLSGQAVSGRSAEPRRAAVGASSEATPGATSPGMRSGPQPGARP